MKTKMIGIITVLIFICFKSINAQIIKIEALKECNSLAEEGKFEEALNCFQNYDTSAIAIYNSSILYHQLQNRKHYKKNAKKLLSKNLRSEENYVLYARLSALDSTGLLKTLQKGLKLYPGNVQLLTEMINYYLKKEDHQTVIKFINDLIKNSPENKKNLYYVKAYTYQMLNDTTNAIHNYEKVIELDTNNFNAYYNLATMYYNQAADIYRLANETPDQKKYYTLRKKAEEQLNLALPYLEIAARLDPDDLIVLEALKQLYLKLDYSKKLIEINKRIKELKNDY